MKQRTIRTVWWFVAGVLCAAVMLDMAVSALNEKNEPRRMVEQALGVQLSAEYFETVQPKEIGFFGDGAALYRYNCPDDTLRSKIEHAADWKPLPMDAVVEALVYGITDGQNQIGPYLTVQADRPMIPPVQNGSYWFCDRQAQHGQAKSEVLSRASLNISVAVYDVDTDTLYFAALDT